MKSKKKKWEELGFGKIENEDDLIEKRDLTRVEYKKLPIDTRYFDEDFKFEMLEKISEKYDLDDVLDGLLIKSENWQALNLILEKYKEKMQTIYIDSPFSKEKEADYLYNVNYKDSTWISMFENRLRLARELLNERGSIFVKCDYNGNWLLRPLMNEIFGKENFRNEIEVRRFKKNVMKKEIKKLPTELDKIYLYSLSEKFSYVKPYKLKDEKRVVFGGTHGRFIWPRYSQNILWQSSGTSSR